MCQNSKLKLAQNFKTQIVTKRKKSNCDKTQQLKLWQNYIKKKVKLWQNLKTLIVTVVLVTVVTVAVVTVIIVKSFGKNYLTPRQLGADFCDSCNVLM